MTYINRDRLTFGALGVVAGIVLGMNLSGFWPQVPLYASATHGQQNFAIATGKVDDEMEAIYFLDFLTGDLKAAVLNPTLGKYNAFFQYNVMGDFGGRLKSPRFLLVTGEANLPRGRANFQYANSIIYVAEASTGQIACYTMPWNSAMQAARKTQTGEFVRLDMKQFRAPEIIRD